MNSALRIDVSVVVAAYNVAPYIVRAVTSALGQEGVSLEVIVVDDCSTDPTWEIISSFSDPRVRAFRLEHNSGPGAARNKGFKEAKGEWVAILDGDDVMLAGRLQRCLVLARRACADIVADNQVIFREADGESRPMYSPRLFRQFPKLTLERYIYAKFAWWTDYPLGYLKPIFSSNFLRKHGIRYDEIVRVAEDYFIMFQSLAVGAHCVLEPSQGYRYTVREGSISHRLTPKHIRLMRETEARFVAVYRVRLRARLLMRLRAFILYDMYIYTEVMEALKARNWKYAARMAVKAPWALRHAWEPVYVRLMRLMVRTLGGKR